jgi:hypothetical protein
MLDGIPGVYRMDHGHCRRGRECSAGVWFHVWLVRCHYRADNFCGGQLTGRPGCEHDSGGKYLSSAINSLIDALAQVFAPIMGFSACFGSPMLNILLGIGISGTYIISQTGRTYELDFSRSLHVSTIGLLCLLGATLVFVPLNRYHLTRKWGILLILSYVIIMIINVAVELKS